MECRHQCSTGVNYSHFDHSFLANQFQSFVQGLFLTEGTFEKNRLETIDFKVNDWKFVSLNGNPVQFSN